MPRVIQISDLHVVARPRRVSGQLDTEGLLEDAIGRILDDMRGFGPIDAVLVTGDVSDDGSPESYALARRQLDRLGLPLMVVPGNHDRREPMREAFADLAGVPARGPIDWAVDLGELRVIGLDTLVEGESGGSLSDASLSFLAAALEGAGGRAVLIAMHHPPFETGIRFMDRIGLSRGGELEVALGGAGGPVRIICGHVHAPIAGAVGSHVALAAPSVCSAFAIDYRVEAPVGFRTGPRGYMVHEWNGRFLSATLTFCETQGPFPF
ncbi:phosphodiesterase [Limibaculum sp. FT325]|uniref:phosphodiesterase n=1 Tax=Thermohalobaculum sediminis TaxID=2939436 RepID=UPI0020C0D418|nr:phosphodiesterase [Limibaculum sediminis]MCL5776242.1 phosphodiesterase [Limibaculum sediminis]